MCASMKKSFLAFRIGGMNRTVYRLLGPTTIGRDPDNTITVVSSTVSRHHAKVSFQDGVWAVEDLGSANGILANGLRCEKLVLKPNATFQLGEVNFSFIEKESSEAKDKLTETVEILTASIEELDLLPKNEEAELWSQQIQKAVAAVPFFSSLGKEERKEVTDTATLRGFGTGEVIIREGDRGRSIFVLINGRVKIFGRDYQEKEFELAILEPGDFFGEMAFLTGKPRLASAMAEETTLLMEVNYNPMRKLIQEHSSVKEVLLEYYVERLKKIKEKRSEIGMEERRRDPRVNEKVPVLIVMLPNTMPIDQVKSRSWKADSVDISKSGILVRVSEAEPEEFQPYDQVLLEINLEADLGKIRTAGIVRRAMLYDMEERITLVGIKFVGMADTDSKKLNDFIYGEALIKQKNF
jgi:CRP-like cAMP-binding protein